jgi:hypothetical protein
MIFPQGQYGEWIEKIDEQLSYLDITPGAYSDILEDIASMLLGGTNRKAPPFGEGDRGHSGGRHAPPFGEMDRGHSGGRHAPPFGEMDRGHSGGGYNRIPSEQTGPCFDTLVAYCFDNDSFKERMNDVVKHIAVCPQTMHVIIITSQWNPKEWKKNHESYFQQIGARVNICLFAFNTMHRIV